MNEDYLDMLAELTAAGARFVVVGAQSLAAHGVPRATVDLDVLVRPDSENAERVFTALGAFGAPLAAHRIAPADFARAGTVYQIGLPPRRIDITTRIDGVDFDEVWLGRVARPVGDLQVPFIGLRELVRNKASAGRHKDLLDLDLLRESGVDVDALLR